ncbi:MAG: ABC transporter substrate-binding protein [Actinobacteria bacterium]|nr:ABC transporter substrate-binding protein [Actinomycetota bacterium]
MPFDMAPATLRTDGAVHHGRLLSRLTERQRMGLLILALAVAAVACSGGESAPANTSSPGDWEAITKTARGQTLDLYMWGGSSEINRFVDRIYGPILEEEYGITLNRIPVADTVDAVNKVLAELQAGRDNGGSVDLIWINGENFYTLRQANALVGGWALQIPNARFVDWDSAAVNRDFGLAVEGSESPLGSAQFQFVYDSARTDEASLPRSYIELGEWIAAHPGRFTYPAPPAFHGTRFIKQAFYELTGGVENWLGPLDETAFAEGSAGLWDFLADINPNLWRSGRTYPPDIASLNRLFANDEVDFTFTQLPGGIQAEIDAGVLPATARPFVFETGTIGDFHYVAIPTNAGDPEAAMVLANLVLAPALQAAKLDPANGWGDGLAISLDLVDGEDRVALQQVMDKLGGAAVSFDRLEEVRLPEVDQAYTLRLEHDWDVFIRQSQLAD